MSDESKTLTRTYLVMTNHDIQVFQCRPWIFRLNVVLGVDMGGATVIVRVPRLVTRSDGRVVDACVIQ